MTVAATARRRADPRSVRALVFAQSLYPWGCAGGAQRSRPCTPPPIGRNACVHAVSEGRGIGPFGRGKGLCCFFFTHRRATPKGADRARSEHARPSPVVGALSHDVAETARPPRDSRPVRALAFAQRPYPCRSAGKGAMPAPLRAPSIGRDPCVHAASEGARDRSFWARERALLRST